MLTFKRFILPILTIIVLALQTGCASVEPWVSPFERSKLADPIMSFSRGPADAAYMHHVRQAREGARGAEGGGGGGCGCN